MPMEHKAQVRSTQSWGPYHLLGIDCPDIGTAAVPGQFVMIKVSDGPLPLLRRPLGVHDADGTGIELFFQATGKGTAMLAGKRPGDAIDVLGPLGKGFTVEGLSGKSAILVGGGRGMAPIYFLARRLLAQKTAVKVLYGGRSSSDMPLLDKFRSLGIDPLCSTDDGSLGHAGLVTVLAAQELGKSRPDILYSCGPDAMMKALAKTVLGIGLRAEFSLESLMGCGIGACWGCVHRIKDESGTAWTKICEQGPVFPAEKIVWTE